MMNVTVLCVGKLKEGYWRDAFREYEKRLGAFCRFQLTEVGEERLDDAPSRAQIERTVEAEGTRLLEKTPKNAVGIALCIEGKLSSSEALAQTLSQMAVQGDSHVVFYIGGSYGLSEAVKSACSLRLSMSPMTFPHQLARVMLMEQIYRAFQIQNGGKYHK